MAVSFTKVKLPFGWLGNMAPYPVMYENKRWNTTEALFQALRYADPEIRELIRKEPSPMGAKMKAKKHRELMVVEPMSEQDLENMKLCVRLKVEQHPRLKRWLLDTGDQQIIEDIGIRKGARHLFWGARREGEEWVGNNMMGKIWMEERVRLISL